MWGCLFHAPALPLTGTRCVQFGSTVTERSICNRLTYMYYLSNRPKPVLTDHGRRGGLLVSALDYGSSVLVLSPVGEHCVVFLGRTLNSHSASLHPGV